MRQVKVTRLFKPTNISLAAMVFAFMVAGPVQSAPRRAELVPTLTSFKVVVKNGEEALLPADKIKPGEIIEYHVEYRNNGRLAVRDLQATLPIPGQLEFVSGSAQPALVRASVDGKTFAGLPLRRRVRAGDGTTQIVAVPASQYRFLRWSIASLGAGQSVVVKARAKLPS